MEGKQEGGDGARDHRPVTSQGIKSDMVSGKSQLSLLSWWGLWWLLGERCPHRPLYLNKWSQVAELFGEAVKPLADGALLTEVCH